MSIVNEIRELVEADVISADTAVKIENYFEQKRISTPNGLFIVFGILGAVLIGLGIIMILAHNWDELSRSTKTVFAFIPLLIGQVLCGYTLMKKQESKTWRESSATFLFFALGACIALISQIYNMPGNLSSFLLVWMLLCLPLVYIMKSSAVSLLYIIGITNYATESRFGFVTGGAHYYWLLLILILPHYYNLYINKPGGNFMALHNWAIPISLVIAASTLVKGSIEFIPIAYMSLFGIFYLLGENSFFEKRKLRSNAYKIIGSIGTIITLLILSFDFFWKELRNQDFDLPTVVSSPEFIGSAVFTLLASVLFYLYVKKRTPNEISPVAPMFVLFLFVFLLGMYTSIPVILINVFLLVIGLWTIREGERRDNFGVLNYGLLIITALVVCRFFDIDLSFIFRGLLFVIVGVGFFLTNYWMLKKRRTND